jgi:hypothetical protein
MATKRAEKTLSGRDICQLALRLAQEEHIALWPSFRERDALVIVELLVRGGRPKAPIIRPRHLTFLQRLATHGNAARAARESGMRGPHVRQTAYRLRQRLQDRFQTYIALQTSRDEPAKRR